VTIEGIWAFVSWLLFGVIAVAIGVVSLVLLRSDGQSRRVTVGCSLGSIGIILFGAVCIATVLGLDLGSILGLHIRMEDVSRVVYAVLTIVFAAIGIWVWLHVDAFAPDSGGGETRDGFVEALFGLRFLEAILVPVFRRLPWRVAVRVSATVYLAFAAVAFVGITSPSVPESVGRAVAGFEAIIALVFYLILTLGLFLAIGGALFGGGERRLREATAYLVVWLVLVAFGFLGGWLTWPIADVLDG
jgi:hypothetical protein